jgi:hypothetical protein
VFVEGTVIPEETASFAGELCSVELNIESPVQYPSNWLSSMISLELFLLVQMLEYYVDIIFYTFTLDVALGEGVSHFVM